MADWTRAMDLVIKTSEAPESYVPAIKQEVQAIDKDQPLGNVRTLESLVTESLAARRFSLMLLGLFALIALVLGAIGLYGVMSYAVTERTREIGIRTALGAQKRDVMKLVIRQGMTVSLTGVATGLAASAALTRVMESQLFDVSATDPATFATIALLLIIVSLLAICVPARRATKVDPIIALRYE
jgi:putative ABC transport system permease protein